MNNGLNARSEVWMREDLKAIFNAIEIAATAGGADLTPRQVLDIVRTAVHIEPRGQRITVLPRSVGQKLMGIPAGDWR